MLPPRARRSARACQEARTATKADSVLARDRLAFGALADSAPGHNLTLVVEAWSDRNDLGDGAKAAVLAASTPLTFVYDDKGFSSAASFVDFSAVETQQGSVTITAKFGNPLTSASAKLISWYGYLPTPTGGFSLDTAILGDQFTTREYPTPEINVSFSQPGVHFFGIYAAWNGQYGASSGTGIHMQAWPRDLKTGKLFRPFAVVTPFENGTIPAGLPANYNGHKIVTKPIPVGRTIPSTRRKPHSLRYTLVH